MRSCLLNGPQLMQHSSKRLWDYKHTGFAMLKKQGTAPQDSLTGQNVNEGSKH